MPQIVEARALASATLEGEENRRVRRSAESLISNIGTIDFGPPSDGTNEDAAGIPSDLDIHADPYPFDPMNLLEWPKPSPTVDCELIADTVEGCGCELRVLPSSCDKGLCGNEFCRNHRRMKRARRIERKLNHARAGRAVLYLVLTIMPSRRKAAAVHENWKWWTKALMAWLKDELGMQFAVERTDVTGDKHPDRWHPHMNVLMVRRPDQAGLLTPEELEALKLQWAVIQGAAGRTVSVWVQYAHPEKPGWNKRYDRPATREERERQIWHWCSYLGRGWPAWEEQFPYALRIKWFGVAPKAPKEESDKCCPGCGRERLTYRCSEKGDDKIKRLSAAAHAAAIKDLGYDALADYVDARRRRLKAMRPGAVAWQKSDVRIVLVSERELFE